MRTEELMRQVQILRDEHERALDEMRQRIEQLNQRCEELAAKLVDCEGLRLADEQTIRNLAGRGKTRDRVDREADLC
jgi:predicted  nucleic acid-binding Zn-ribbon protein